MSMWRTRPTEFTFFAMVISRLQEFAKGVRNQRRNARRWAQEAPAGKLKLEFWSGPATDAESKPRSASKPADSDDHSQIWPPDVDAEVTTGSGSAGMSVWEGVVPDPVDPMQPVKLEEPGHSRKPG
jgi:hypothetical protein